MEDCARVFMSGDGALGASGQHESVQVDVSREPRRTKVRPPVLNQQVPERDPQWQ